MKDEFGIYAVSTGRICLAALNTKNLDLRCQGYRRCNQGLIRACPAFGALQQGN